MLSAVTTCRLLMYHYCCMSSSGQQGHDGASLCVHDSEGGGSPHGAPQPNLPSRTRGGPHQSHYETRTIGGSLTIMLERGGDPKTLLILCMTAPFGHVYW